MMMNALFKTLVSFFLISTAKCTEQRLNMEVEWCLQGNTASFTGFFTEILGFSSGLVEILPKSRLVKSLFDNSFDEFVLPRDSKIYDELFDKERDNIRHLASQAHSTIAMSEEAYLKFMNQSSEVDATIECASPEEYIPPPQASTQKKYLDSSRPFVEIITDDGSSTTASPSDSIAVSRGACCHACAAEPLCLAWTHSEEGFCHLKTRFEKEPLQHLSVVKKETTAASFSSVMKPRKFHTPRAVIFHGTMCSYQNLSIMEQKRDINTIYIGRYMFERGSVSLYQNMGQEEYKVLMCLLRMDEVWVPTQWLKTELERVSEMMGFNFPHVAVVPEAVDATLFDPAIGQTNKDDAAAVTVTVADDENSTQLYQFLSIFKWEDRKGWDLLLKAYWTAFSPDDNVILRLHTYRPSFLIMHGQVNVTENLVIFARNTFGKELCQLARVALNDDVNTRKDSCDVSEDNTCQKDDIQMFVEGKERSDNLNRVEMRQLLQSSDAFVLPTRGEGWCLPAAEAMAMALPVIITNYSGPTAFANDENAYLIPVHEEINRDGFVEPDVDVLISLMQHVKAYPQEAKEKGKRARSTMEVLSPRAVVAMMADRLRDLAEMRGWKE